MRTVTLRGAGGAVWEQDVPDEGTSARLQWDKDIEAGRLTIVSATEVDELGAGSGNGEKSAESDPASAQGDETPEPEPVVIPDDVAKTIDGLTGWVDQGISDEDKAARAAAVLAAEKAKDKPRPTLLGHIRSLLGLNDDDTPATPATPEA